jgi:uncharacterized protein YceH (UPF0502 family)
MFDNPLDAVSIRVLGSLIEKEHTTPDNYPLTVNALVAAANQTTNREPVMQLDEAAVLSALKTLIQRSFVHEVHRSDSRARRYRQVMSEKLSLHQPEMAVLCVLMLRGPQTVGELKTRGARIFEFVDLRHVEVTLDSLMTLDPPLVAQLARQPGQKEVRYAHLLAGQPEIPVPEAQPQLAPQNGDDDRMTALERTVESLRGELTALRETFEQFRQQFQ